MSSSTNGPVLVERSEVHKSCKSIEALLSILNEYCEATGAIVAIQKKLAKSLRETAAQKAVVDIAANAMQASANMFEALSDVDSKFSKIADKEYDIVSAEVKKWFKKLAKEEKTHDEKIGNSNAKIKQAGQVYEKKSKKKAVDTAEEHARYIHLISTLGPEVSQEKYNHALIVTRKHTTATYVVASCISRIADTEWQKSCECIRRFSPIVGILGHWRALSEGGWAGPIPPDLPDLGNGTTNSQRNLEPTSLKVIEEPQQLLEAIPTSLIPEPRGSPFGYSAEPLSASQSFTDLSRSQNIPASNSPTLARQSQPQPNYPIGPSTASESSNEPARVQQNSARSSPTLPRQNQPTATSPTALLDTNPVIHSSNNLEPPNPPFVDPNTGSVRSLSAFPPPPTHFPLPPLRSQQSSTSMSLNFPSAGQLFESPSSADDDIGPSTVANRKTHEVESLVSPSPEQLRQPTKLSEEHKHDGHSSIPTSAAELKRPIPVRSQTAVPQESVYQGHREIFYDERPGPSSLDGYSPNTRRTKREEYEREINEFGVLNNDEVMHSGSKAADNKVSRVLDRTDTGASSGSLVAAMRSRYNNSGVPSPPPRDLPRLSLSVNNLATRYDAPLSPRGGANSPPVLRQQSSPLDITTRQQEAYRNRQNFPSPDRERHPRQSDDYFEQKVKQQEIRERERELELRSRQLEEEKVRLQALHQSGRNGRDAEPQNGQFGLKPRERRISLRSLLPRSLSRMELDEAESMKKMPSQSNNSPHLRTQGSYSTTNLVSPSNASQSDSRSEAQYIRDRYADDGGSSSNTASDHAPACGCEKCSISKYKISSSRPQPNVAEKSSTKGSSGGWMRRLSMPVGNAFNLDSKRHQSNNSTSSHTSNYSLGTGLGNLPVNRSVYAMDGKKNASTTALSRMNDPNGKDRGLAAQEDGRLRILEGGAAQGRRSYEANEVGNRSMTSLGLSGRH